MNKRDDLLFYARNLTDQRVHRIVGRCIAEGGRQITNPEPEPTTPSIRTELAADLLDLPDEIVTDLQGLVLGLKYASEEARSAIHLLLTLRPDYAHMVSVFAQSLYDAQTVTQPQEEEEEEAAV